MISIPTLLVLPVSISCLCLNKETRAFPLPSSRAPLVKTVCQGRDEFENRYNVSERIGVKRRKGAVSCHYEEMTHLQELKISQRRRCLQKVRQDDQFSVIEYLKGKTTALQNRRITAAWRRSPIYPTRSLLADWIADLLPFPRSVACYSNRDSPAQAILTSIKLEISLCILLTNNLAVVEPVSLSFDSSNN